MSLAPLVIKPGFLFRKLTFAGLAGIFYAHSVQSMNVMAISAKEKEQKTERDRIAAEAVNNKKALEAANALLDKYRAHYPSLEPPAKTVEAGEGPSFTYSNIESGDYIESLATSYDAAENFDSYNDDRANEVVEHAENRA